jgi:hypothetical protein
VDATQAALIPLLVAQSAEISTGGSIGTYQNVRSRAQKCIRRDTVIIKLLFPSLKRLKSQQMIMF